MTILDPKWKYEPSTATNIRRRFAKVRRELAKAAPEPPRSISVAEFWRIYESLEELTLERAFRASTRLKEPLLRSVK